MKKVLSLLPLFVVEQRCSEAMEKLTAIASRATSGSAWRYSEAL